MNLSVGGKMVAKAKDLMFGPRLRELRAEAGLSQAELAERAGLHRLGIAKLERSERDPTWATVQALARALGVTCLAFQEPPKTTLES